MVSCIVAGTWLARVGMRAYFTLGLCSEYRVGVQDHTLYQNSATTKAVGAGVCGRVRATLGTQEPQGDAAVKSPVSPVVSVTPFKLTATHLPRSVVSAPYAFCSRQTYSATGELCLS